MTNKERWWKGRNFLLIAILLIAPVQSGCRLFEDHDPYEGGSHAIPVVSGTATFNGAGTAQIVVNLFEENSTAPNVSRLEIWTGSTMRQLDAPSAQQPPTRPPQYVDTTAPWSLGPHSVDYVPYMNWFYIFAKVTETDAGGVNLTPRYFLKLWNIQDAHQAGGFDEL